jgi:hypothetical protein
MTLSLPLMVGLAVLVFLFLVVGLAWRSSRAVSSRVSSRAGAGVPPQTSASEGERLAAASSESIEELANQALAKAGVTGLRVDFGTAHDGSLEIWVGEDRYTSVDSIPDERVRRAVAEAVASFNR